MTTPPPPEYFPPSGDGDLVLPMNDDDKNMGMLAHGGTILIGFLAPLLIMLIKKDSAFAQQEAKESLNFQIWVTIALTVSGISMIVLIGFCLFPVVLIGALVFEIMATIKVSGGNAYRYPFNFRILK